MARIWECSQHSGGKLLMMQAIGDFADDDGRAYPAVPTLAAKCRMNVRNANYVLTALQASGELEILVNQGPRGTNLYRIVLERLGVQPVASLQGLAPLQRLADTPAMACTPPLQPVADEPPLNHQEPERGAKPAPPSKSTRKKKTEMPADFGISDRVRGWAAGHQFLRLDEHLDAFRRKVAAKGYTYVDWDAAFMEAIRLDWARLRTATNTADQKSGATTVPGPSGKDPELQRMEQDAHKSAQPSADVKAHADAIRVAAGRRPWQSA